MPRKNARAKACDISGATKKKVYARDGGCCVLCGSSQGLPNAHIISQANGGLGIERNIVTLCGIMSENKRHYKFDNGTEEEKERIYEQIKTHMTIHYTDWREGEYVFKSRWAEIDAAAFRRKKEKKADD